MNTRKCGRCLLSEFEAGRLAETVRGHIALIPEDKKTPPDEYERRLETCRGCGALNDGLCGECGCFVEVRAAKAYMGCPVNLWKKL
ncbi:MAG: DUF6171 family protein [Lachnospiraceae bacterium]|nr:DUF6171 family protein [Ruminococcus sp.]MCM1274055.1 DUF6171 family protein [Lachnospiraceae bacterium]